MSHDYSLNFTKKKNNKQFSFFLIVENRRYVHEKTLRRKEIRIKLYGEINGICNNLNVCKGLLRNMLGKKNK